MMPEGKTSQPKSEKGFLVHKKIQGKAKRETALNFRPNRSSTRRVSTLDSSASTYPSTIDVTIASRDILTVVGGPTYRSGFSFSLTNAISGQPAGLALSTAARSDSPLTFNGGVSLVNATTLSGNGTIRLPSGASSSVIGGSSGIYTGGWVNGWLRSNGNPGGFAFTVQVSGEICFVPEQVGWGPVLSLATAQASQVIRLTGAGFLPSLYAGVDLNLNGFVDALVGIPNSSPPQVRVIWDINGPNFRLLAGRLLSSLNCSQALTITGPIGSEFGRYIHSVGNVTGSGPTVLIAANNALHFLFPGPHLSNLCNLSAPFAPGQGANITGSSLASGGVTDGGNLNDDAYDDFAFTTFPAAGPSETRFFYGARNWGSTGQVDINSSICRMLGVPSSIATDIGAPMQSIQMLNMGDNRSAIARGEPGYSANGATNVGRVDIFRPFPGFCANGTMNLNATIANGRELITLTGPIQNNTYFGGTIGAFPIVPNGTQTLFVNGHLIDAPGVTDAGATYSFYPGVTPKVVNNQLTITRGSTVVLSPDNLSATLNGYADPTLRFQITDVQHGAVSSQFFTQQQIRDGQINITHDGSDQPISYRVKVFNPKGFASDSSLVSAQVTFVNDSSSSAKMSSSSSSAAVSSSSELPSSSSAAVSSSSELPSSSSAVVSSSSELPSSSSAVVSSSSELPSSSSAVVSSSSELPSSSSAVVSSSSELPPSSSAAVASSSELPSSSSAAVSSSSELPSSSAAVSSSSELPPSSSAAVSSSSELPSSSSAAVSSSSELPSSSSAAVSSSSAAVSSSSALPPPSSSSAMDSSSSAGIASGLSSALEVVSSCSLTGTSISAIERMSSTTLSLASSALALTGSSSSDGNWETSSGELAIVSASSFVENNWVKILLALITAVLIGIYILASRLYYGFGARRTEAALDNYFKTKNSTGSLINLRKTSIKTKQEYECISTVTKEVFSHLRADMREAKESDDETQEYEEQIQVYETAFEKLFNKLNINWKNNRWRSNKNLKELGKTIGNTIKQDLKQSQHCIELQCFGKKKPILGCLPRTHDSIVGKKPRLDPDWLSENADRIVALMKYAEKFKDDKTETEESTSSDFTPAASNASSRQPSPRHHSRPSPTILPRTFRRSTRHSPRYGNGGTVAILLLDDNETLAQGGASELVPGREGVELAERSSRADTNSLASLQLSSSVSPLARAAASSDAFGSASTLSLSSSPLRRPRQLRVPAHNPDDMKLVILDGGRETDELSARISLGNTQPGERDSVTIDSDGHKEALEDTPSVMPGHDWHTIKNISQKISQLKMALAHEGNHSQAFIGYKQSDLRELDQLKDQLSATYQASEEGQHLLEDITQVRQKWLQKIADQKQAEEESRKKREESESGGVESELDSNVASATSTSMGKKRFGFWRGNGANDAKKVNVTGSSTSSADAEVVSDFEVGSPPPSRSGLSGSSADDMELTSMNSGRRLRNEF